jgi:hypothetical protein
MKNGIIDIGQGMDHAFAALREQPRPLLLAASRPASAASPSVSRPWQKKTVTGMTRRRFFCRSAPLFKCEDRQGRSEFFSATCTPTIEVDGSVSLELYRKKGSRRLTSRRPVHKRRDPKACPNTGRSLESFRTSLHRVRHHRGKIPTPAFRSPRSSRHRRTAPTGSKRQTVRRRP